MASNPYPRKLLSSFRSDVFPVIPEFREAKYPGPRDARALGAGSRADALGRHDNEAMVPEARSGRNLLYAPLGHCLALILRLLATTLTLETAIAAAAITGLSNPSAASGMAATL